jgi:hypothetical protein
VRRGAAREQERSTEVRGRSKISRLFGIYFISVGTWVPFPSLARFAPGLGRE